MSKEKRGRKCSADKPQKPGRTGIFNRPTQNFKWSFAKCIWEHEQWQSYKDDVPWFVENIISKLQGYESQLWQSIESASGGKREGNGSNSHFIPINKLSKEATIVLSKAGLIRDFDKIFSLRLTAKQRLIGVVEGAIFYVLWFDDNHQTIPTTK